MPQINAATRHGTTLPSKNTTKKPRAAEMPAQATKAPRIDGCLQSIIMRLTIAKTFMDISYDISPMYVMVGDSIRPVPSPRISNAAKISISVLEK